MTRSELLSKLWDCSCVAGMNQRYCESLEANWIAAAGAVNLVGISLAALSVGAILANRSSGRPGPWIGCYALPVFVLLASLWPFSESIRTATGLRWHWTQLRADADLLTLAVQRLDGEVVPTWYAERLSEIHSRRIRIMAFEPPVDQALLDRCFEAECRSRGASFDRSAKSG